jgi:hypothetical protein
MARIALVVAVVLCAARVAHAGICEVPGAYETIAEALDARAAEAHPHKADQDFSTCLRTQMTDAPRTAPKLVARMLAACTVILDKAPRDGMCTELAARLGLSELGSHDIVALLAARKNVASDYWANEMLEATHASRAAAVVIARWTELQPVADGKPKDTDLQQDWATWRTRAAHALGALGGEDAKEFLAAQVARPIDRGVKRACTAAIGAIVARLAAAQDP